MRNDEAAHRGRSVTYLSPPPNLARLELAAHHRKRTRQAEGRADGLARELAKAYRLLALALRVAAGYECSPLALLRVIEQLDGTIPQRATSIDKLAVLLRETAP